MRKHRLAERLLVDVIGLGVGVRARRGMPLGARHVGGRSSAGCSSSSATRRVAVRQPDPGPRRTRGPAVGQRHQRLRRPPRHARRVGRATSRTGSSYDGSASRCRPTDPDGVATARGSHARRDVKVTTSAGESSWGPAWSTPSSISRPRATSSWPTAPAPDSRAWRGSVVSRPSPPLDVAGALQLLSAGALLVDVREEREYVAGHAPGAVNLPLSRIRKDRGSLPEGRDLVVMCRSGHRSAIAARALGSRGAGRHQPGRRHHRLVGAGEPVVPVRRPRATEGPLMLQMCDLNVTNPPTSRSLIGLPLLVGVPDAIAESCPTSRSRRAPSAGQEWGNHTFRGPDGPCSPSGPWGEAAFVRPGQLRSEPDSSPRRRRRRIACARHVHGCCPLRFARPSAPRPSRRGGCRPRRWSRRPDDVHHPGSGLRVADLEHQHRSFGGRREVAAARTTASATKVRITSAASVTKMRAPRRSPKKKTRASRRRRSSRPRGSTTAATTATAARRPAGFDCSGYTRYVFGKLGKSLPHNAAAQSALVHHVAAPAPAPGDLIFFHSSSGHVYHVGIYAGHGKLYHASQYGVRTGLGTIFSSNVTFGRV